MPAESARDQLLNLSNSPDLHAHDPKDLLEVQLAAAQEMFEEHRGEVAPLDFRAREANIEKIRSVADLVPLLFAHASYKSYPMSFITHGRWDRLLKWYDSMSAVPVRDVPLDDVATIDDFVDRLWEHGYYACLTSGTSGKCSFLNHTDADRRLSAEMRMQHWGWPGSSEVGGKLRAYRFAPPSGPNRGLDNWRNSVAHFADPDQVQYLIDEPMRPSHHMEAGALRAAIANGTASPADIARYEEQTAQRAARVAERFEAMVDDIVAHLDEPLLLAGGWARQHQLVEALRARGVAPGRFHPDTIISAGGGRKDPSTPRDVVEQVFRFYGPVRRVNSGYSMSEMSDAHRECEHGRYHFLPWVLVLVLDESGERLLGPAEGRVEGRYACVDVSYQGRWGGVISGDRVVVDSGPCPCGRPGATILPGIERYGELDDDDKVLCAAAVDQYVRGLVGA